MNFKNILSRKTGLTEPMVHAGKKQLVKRLAGFLLVLFLFSGCNFDWDEFIDDHKNDKRLQLREVVINARHYVFNYNQRGDVTSIEAREGNSLIYEYRVAYNGTKIDSVSTVNNGVVESVNNRFEYDAKDRITYYNYRLILYGQPPDVLFNHWIKYDNRSRISEIITDFDGLNRDTTRYTYDNRNNIITGFDGTYTYDKGLNPLYYVNDLFALVVEEPFMWEFIFSQHNTTSKTTNGSVITFENEYDSYHRITRKVHYQNGAVVGETLFSYYE